MIFDTLTDEIVKKQNPTCVGLDTTLAYLPQSLTSGVKGLKSAADAIYRFNCAIVDAVEDIVPAVKVQIAYYEAYGPAGLDAFKKTCAYAKKHGLFVIVDAKRNDIGATAAQYATAFFGKTETGTRTTRTFPCDILTVNGYLGTDGILPFLETGRGGIFVLVKTSNPSSGELQDLRLEDGRTVYECMGDKVEEWGRKSRGKYGFSRVGAVVGATYPKQAEILRARLPHTFFLIPGYGAQGGNAEMLKACFLPHGRGGIVNNSRGILCAWKKTGGDFAEEARHACLAMKEDLLSVLGEICAK